MLNPGKPINHPPIQARTKNGQIFSGCRLHENALVWKGMFLMPMNMTIFIWGRFSDNVRIYETRRALERLGFTDGYVDLSRPNDDDLIAAGEGLNLARIN